MKKKIYWSLPIIAFFVQYILMGFGFSLASAIVSDEVLTISEWCEVFLGWGFVPLLPVALFPPLLLIPIAGIVMGYIYTRAVVDGHIISATVTFYLVGTITIISFLFVHSGGIIYIVSAMPFSYIISLSIAAVKLRHWAK